MPSYDQYQFLFDMAVKGLKPEIDQRPQLDLPKIIVQ